MNVDKRYTDLLDYMVQPKGHNHSGDKTICYGDSIQIEAFGGINFNWISTDSISNQSISNC